MTWEKLGLIWQPTGNFWWNKKYGQLPVPYYLPEENIIRVFFGTACDDTFCRITFVDVDADNPTHIVYEHSAPVLDIGDLGTFDDSGVVPSSIMKKGNDLLLYTVGYQRCGRVPYMLFAGLARSSDNGLSFQRVSKAPVLPRKNTRPTGQGAPSVIFHEGLYKMWHWFSTKWITVEGKLFLDYQIGYAESADGITWDMKDRVCLAPDEAKGEFAVARPWVLFEDEKFKMWYSIRLVGKKYRIGYAESSDGLVWNRMDHVAGIDVSPEGWDSEMVCYPAIIDVKENRYMFYNGNSNGLTGFGIARLQR